MPIKIKVSEFIKSIIQSGVKNGMSYQQRRKVITVNLAGIIGGICSIAFLFSNLLSGNELLCWLDTFTMICGLSMPVLQRFNLRDYPPIIGVSVLSLCCATSAFFYHNNTEYFLLLFMGVSFIIWDGRWLATGFALVNAVLFFALELNDRPPVMVPVPTWNKRVVLCICLVLYMGFLYYFKQMYSQYLQRIELQNRELVRWNRHNEKIMSVVAHDIRAPISNVHSVLVMLKEGVLSREEFDAVSSQLISHVSNLEISIAALLGWSKNQINNPSANGHEFSLYALIDEVRDFLRFQMESKTISLDLQQLSDLQLYADRDQVEIIFRNLISNAIKFSYPGSTVYVGSSVEQGKGYIFVKDEGKGIDSEHLQNIFSGGELVSTYGTGNEKGTGLGLKLAKDFAILNDGDLNIVSELSVGTTCQVFLPLAELSSPLSGNEP